LLLQTGQFLPTSGDGLLDLGELLYRLLALRGGLGLDHLLGGGVGLGEGGKDCPGTEQQGKQDNTQGQDGVSSGLLVFHG